MTNRSSSDTLYVCAKHAFKGKNNDELTFNVGEVIAVTQQVEGGWWEGTLNGETGWFPSQYVALVTDKDVHARLRSEPGTSISGFSNGNGHDGSFTESTTKKQFVSIVLDSFVNSEAAYIHTLKKIVEDYLDPLSKSDILSSNEFHTVEGGLSRIYAIQARVFLQLKSSTSLELSEQRVGGILLACASEVKEALLSYCYNHPDAVNVITADHEKLAAFFESCGGEMKKFIQGLSEPFRHLSKYPVSLQELHRNLPDSHADRGDVQRSCVVFRQLKDECEVMRRQREQQLDLISTPSVSGFIREKEPGEIVRVGVVSAAKGDNAGEDRTLALFSHLLVILEMQGNGTDYSFIATIPLSQLKVKLSEEKNTIDISLGNQQASFEFCTAVELELWLSCFASNGVVVHGDTKGSMMDVKKRKRREGSEEKETNMGWNGEVRRRESRDGQSRNARLQSPLNESLPFRVNHELEMILPDCAEDEEDKPRRTCENNLYLRHYPPYRVLGNTVDLSKKGIKMRKDHTPEQGDAALLAIVEGYLGVGEDKGRGSHDMPQLIVADDEKLLVEQVVDGQTIVTEKSLVDVVYALKDQVDSMAKEISSLRNLVDKEQKARRRLEESIKRSSLHLSTPKSLLDTSS